MNEPRGQSLRARISHSLSRSSLAPRQPSTPTLLRGYLVVGSLLLAGVALFYTNRVLIRLHEQTTTLSTVMARLVAFSSLSVAEKPDSNFVDSYREIVRTIRFPFVITDPRGRPRAWNLLTGVDPDVVADDVVEHFDLNHPPPPMDVLMRRVQQYDEMNAPVALTRPGETAVQGYLHFGLPPIVDEIRWVPFMLVLAAGLFAFVGILWFRSLRRSEQNLIWAGMARETAHQLGTPISSLMGWMELAREAAEKRPDGTTVLPTALFDDVDTEVRQDLERLARVASRFGHIGSLPSLSLQDIVPIVASTVGYFQRRLPRQGLNLRIEEKFDTDVPPVNVNAELIGWVIENLVKNAIDASDARTGRIDVTIHRRPESETVEISIKDNGRGISPADQKRIFAPGYTTRARGWGLGLTLARRIVEEYHGGRLELRSSVPGKGTEFVVSFPV